ncbi:MAG: hypothetical protein ACE37F_03685 [Nannocystaceae bacterium]|nr:hypothetical protein [bacterium]
MIQVKVDDELVVGKRHPYPLEGRVCVHILAPYRECAADDRQGDRAEHQAEEDLLRRLYRVCRWAEENGSLLRELNKRFEAELARDDSVLSPTGLSEKLMAEPAGKDRIHALCLMSDRYDSKLCHLVRQHSAMLGCPDLDVAESSWEFLALNDFYEDRVPHGAK